MTRTKTDIGQSRCATGDTGRILPSGCLPGTETLQFLYCPRKQAGPSHCKGLLGVPRAASLMGRGIPAHPTSKPSALPAPQCTTCQETREKCLISGSSSTKYSCEMEKQLNCDLSVRNMVK